jgi:hypothetical protein
MQGSPFFLTAKRNYSDSDAAAFILVEATPLAPDYLQVLLTAPHSQTALLTNRSYVYDIQWVDGTAVSRPSSRASSVSTWTRRRRLPDGRAPRHHR